ncbi:hemolysin activation/secretion protein [Sphingomonas sp. SORGH_AS 879]|nr:hemolysin activation/secretion protein [Sphingomonas sp. SORGH_AS_0879]
MHCKRFARWLPALLICGGQQALAQTAVERNLPPAPAAPNPGLVVPDAVPAQQDDTPLGATLRAIVLLGDGERPVEAAGVADGVDAGRVAILNNDGARRVLRRFLGQPLTRRRIAEIEAEIARLARATGRPFISLSTPEQEITGGVLQIRVTEFRLGSLKVTGVSTAEAERIGRALRVAPGEPINSRALSEDLAWLNRLPVRDTSARFAPADAAGRTDLTVVVEEPRQFRLYAGSSNTGSQSTGLARLFVGAVADIRLLPGAYISYQLTGSRDLLIDEGRFFAPKRPRYVAQGARVAIPTFARENVELTFSDSLTNQHPNALFTVRQRTTELTLAYRSALSNAGLPAGFGDMLFGIELKRQHRTVLFGPLTALDVSADIRQYMVGWSRDWFGNGEQGSANIAVHVSPGGSAAELAAITNGRTRNSRFGYVTFDLRHVQRLTRDLSLTQSATLQYAKSALPLSTQIGLGGDGLARGYTTDDGAFDTGFVLRNDLNLPVTSLFAKGGPNGDVLAPRVFFDLAYGLDRITHQSSTLVSAGLGGDYRMGRAFTLGVDGGWALTNGLRSRAGSPRVQARASLSF